MTKNKVTIDQNIVYEMIQWFSEEKSDKFINEFMNTPFNQLIKYHNTLGREIRNKYKLWSQPWTEIIKNGCDVSPDHPDARSLIIIEDVWHAIHNQNEKGKNINGQK